VRVEGSRKQVVASSSVLKATQNRATSASMTEIAGRLEPHSETTMLLTAVSEAVERYDPSTEAVILLETESGVGAQWELPGARGA
jgi:hypothetical protein